MSAIWRCPTVVPPAVNGIPSCVNRGLLQDTLRGALGFKGFVVTDCTGTAGLLGCSNAPAGRPAKRGAHPCYTRWKGLVYTPAPLRQLPRPALGLASPPVTQCDSCTYRHPVCSHQSHCWATPLWVCLYQQPAQCLGPGPEGRNRQAQEQPHALCLNRSSRLQQRAAINRCLWATSRHLPHNSCSLACHAALPMHRHAPSCRHELPHPL